jgi:hypothetical protein
MCDRQTPDRQIISVIRTRGFRAVQYVTLFVAAGLLCCGPWITPCAAGAESGDQQVGSDSYEKMWKQTFSAPSSCNASVTCRPPTPPKNR